MESTRVVSLADVERLRAQERSLAEEEASAMPESSAEQSQTPWEDEPTRTMPVPSTRQPWFVMVKGKQEGPLDEAALGELVATGTVTPRNFFWQQGMADWKRGADIVELAIVFASAVEAAPPPPPPPPPAPAPARPSPASAARAPSEPEPSLTSWQPEPEVPSKTTWQPDADEVVASAPRWMDEEPATRIDGDAQGRAQTLTQAQDPDFEQGRDREARDLEALPRTASRTDAPLGELFSDLDLPAEQEPQPQGEEALAALGEAPARPQVENTSYYVNKAGVNRRNPPWKIALFVLLLVGIPLAALYLLSELQVVPPLKVTRVDAQGRTVEENVSYFSSEGMGELRDRMLGQQKPPPAPPPAPAPPPKPEPAPAPKAPTAEEKPAEQGLTPPEGEANKELQQLYADSAKQDVGPEARKDAEVADKDTAAQAGPPQEVIDRVVRKAQGAFEGCITQALRKGARFRDGKAVLTATVAASGTVTKAAFDRKDVENSEMGRCIKARARKLVFPRFTGEAVDVEIPLILTKAL